MDETPKQRLDRELNELMQGLRVAIPGVQFMFAFLLTVPFAQGFAKVTEFQRDVFLVALISTLLSSVFFIAPAVQHRMLFRGGAKDVLLHRSNRYGIAGAAALSVAMTSAVMLVVDYLFGRAWSLSVAIPLAVLIGWVWLLEPVITRKRRNDDYLP
ncbi:DUF6328 family protein [Streptomyces sp. SID3343]|uniref:DUF6328 family protein n=1 Tax=Streptomyces sp. SID3343 TaxID=2690260 RepID=UPI0013683A4A|nr:DUF6328 family protein [Streptomyces sp. SID3343]MYW06135.1 hypothetical protein [Streptomyces sp. SID3343]